MVYLKGKVVNAKMTEFEEVKHSKLGRILFALFMFIIPPLGLLCLLETLCKSCKKHYKYTYMVKYENGDIDTIKLDSRKKADMLVRKQIEATTL